MLTVTREQHAVGQGFFHSASLKFESSQLNYVYDCGSENSEPLKREVSHFCNRLTGPLDILFLSHMDYDHVSGVDQLLSLKKTETVILPYLSVFERLALVAQAIENDNANFTYIQLLADPITWLQARNVSRILFIDGDDDDESPQPSFPQNPPPRHDKHQKRNELEPDFTSFEETARRKVIRGGPAVSRVNCTHPLGVTKNHHYLDWYFLTFVHPEKAAQKHFRTLVARLWNKDNPGQLFPIDSLSAPKSLSTWLNTVLLDRRKRDQLVECYKAIRIDRNLTSMSLYSGPLQRSEGQIQGQIHRFIGGGDIYHFHYRGHAERALGWLATGDANLKGERRRRKFLAHFSQVRRNTGTLALPHHGSRHNFDAELLWDNVDSYIVSAGRTNRHGHPHDEVSKSVRDENQFLTVVTEEAGSSLVERIEIL